MKRRDFLKAVVAIPAVLTLPVLAKTNGLGEKPLLVHAHEAGPLPDIKAINDLVNDQLFKAAAVKSEPMTATEVQRRWKVIGVDMAKPGEDKTVYATFEPDGTIKYHDLSKVL